MSLNELNTIHHTYKGMVQDQLNSPNAENNHILNFNLKIGNYVMMHHLIHTITAGIGLTGLRMVIGERIEGVTLNYLGAKRA
jgi:hypothetical protein